ncbi:hypothetical protein AB0I16_28210 [Streptomyces sp. NPDC050703]|uniref:hypothetical protein n=1 Tax=Streptomyces sp. NPDC050703 TaxID=3157218 RepID=UPI003441453A
MKRRWAGLVPALLAVSAGLVLAVCGTGPSAHDEAPGYAREDGVPRVRDEKDLPALPLDRYEFSGREQQRIEEALARVTQRCMRSHGFEDFPLHPGWGTKMAASFNLVAISVSPYGTLDLAHARRWGYGLDPALLEEQRDGPGNQGRVPTDAERRVLDGTGGRGGRAEVVGGREVPEGGCEALAARRLLQDEKAARQRSFVPERVEKLDKAVAADQRVRRAFRDWSRCMAGKGFTSYESPAAAAGDKAWFRGRQDGNTARTEKELATAVADVECNRALNTAGVRWAVSAEKQRAELRAHKGRYEAVRAHLDRVRAIVREELD